MGKSEKQIEKEKARNQRIIDTAFQIFVEKKICLLYTSPSPRDRG